MCGWIFQHVTYMFSHPSKALPAAPLGANGFTTTAGTLVPPSHRVHFSPRRGWLFPPMQKEAPFLKITFFDSSHWEMI